MIKKILLFSFLIIIIPFIIVTIFIVDDEKKFIYSSNNVVRVYREDIKVIENVPLEEYIIGVLAGEMPVIFEMEALKAQAVASRSYVMKQMERNVDKDYDVIDTVLNQVYLDREKLMTVWMESFDSNISVIEEAVLSTKGEYLEYNGEVVEALFFSTSPGMTENSEEIFSSKVSYLRSVESNWDLNSPSYTSSKTYTLEEFYKKLNLNYEKNVDIEVLSTTSTGRVKEIKINGVKFTSKELSSKLSLKSTYFEILQSDNFIIINNKGYGHGVGMSQYGAQGMALEGYKYNEILNHYYTDVKIKKI